MSAERTEVWSTDEVKDLVVFGAVLRFAFTRTKVQAVRIFSGRTKLDVEVERSVTLAVAWSKQRIEVRGGKPLRLEVDYLGEQPQLIEVQWIVPPAAEVAEMSFRPDRLERVPGRTGELLRSLVPVRAGAVTAQSPELREADARQLLATHRAESGGLDVDAVHCGCPAPSGTETHDGHGTREAREEVLALFEQRRAAIDLRARIDCFFLLLDRETDENLTDGESVNSTLRLLLASEAKRQLAARGGRRARWSPSLAESEVIRSIAKIFDRCLSDAHLEESDLDFAFELFVSGRLSVPHPDPVLRHMLKTHGATNGEFFFLFGELALAIAGSSRYSEAMRETWASRAATFVRTAHLLADYSWADVEPTDGEVALTPYQYFDGYSMGFARIEAARAAYAAATAALGFGGGLDLEGRLTVLEGWLGRVLLNVEGVAPAEEHSALGPTLPEFEEGPTPILVED